MNAGRVTTALLAAALVQGGCYSYRLVEPEELAPGSEVRTRLSVTEAERFREHVPTADRVLEGRYIGRTGEGILLEVPIARDARGDRIETLHQRVDLAMPGILELEVKELNRTRTLLVAGAGVALVAAVLAPRLTSGGNTGGGEGEPGPEAPFVFGLTVPFGR